jgi:uncharacterized protein YjbI with pentapeptide repeats/tRNA A-37 threonylcarbamoyl transferase component Bud32
MYQDPADHLKSAADQVELKSDADADGDLKHARELEQRYFVDKQIGQGGMGTVYLGRLKSINKPVAIKRLPDSVATAVAYKRLRREAQAITALNHPGIVQLHDYGLDPDGPYLVMEYVDGETLSERLKRERTLDRETCLQVFDEVCAALAHAHSHGVVHRDLKPSNIMLAKADDGGQRVKLVDFGLANTDLTGDPMQRLTETGEIIGSPLYMSPEQCQGLPLDARSDVYSVGCVLFEALTGAPPFLGDTNLAIVLHHLNTPVKIPPGVPPAFQNVLLRALEKDREKRYQSIQELRSDLKRVAGGETPRYRTGISKNTKYGVLAVVVIASLLLAIGALLVLFAPVPVDIKNADGKVIYSMWGKPGDTARSAVQEANRKGTDLENAILDGADLSGLTIDNTSLVGSSLINANLKKTRFVVGTSDKHVLELANLSGADLTGAVLKTQLLEDNFSRATLIEADLDGGLDFDDFSEANLSHATIQNNSGGRQPTTFDKANLSHATLRGWYPQTIFRRANMQYADLTNTTFLACDFTDADLTGADFSGADISDCCFTGAKVAGAKFKGTKGLDKAVGLDR